MLRRGFWLYVWRVARLGKDDLLYVGRTGDNSSPYASPPYIRMGQHLGSVQSQNALRTHLARRKVLLQGCEQFDLIAHGPIYPEVSKPAGFKHGDKVATAKLMLLHQPIRDIVGAMEKQLAVELSTAGYDVMNVVKTRHKVQPADWLPVREAFAKDFPKLQALG